MSFFDPNHPIITPSAVGDGLKIDAENGKLTYFNYDISLPQGVKVSAVIGRTIYLVGSGITGTITFTVFGDGMIQYWGTYKGENVTQTLFFRKGRLLEDEKIGWTIR